MATKKTGVTPVPTPSADARGEVRSFRTRMKNGRDILVIGTDSKEAEDIIGSRNEDIESNERKHGYWHPDQGPSRPTDTGRSIFMVPAMPWKDE